MYRLLRTINDECKTVEDVDALYFDGYGFGDQQLEGVVIKLTLNSSGQPVIDIATGLPRGVSKADVKRDALDYALGLDVFSVTPALEDDDGVLWNEHLTVEDQASAWPGAPRVLNGPQLGRPSGTGVPAQAKPKSGALGAPTMIAKRSIADFL